MFREMLHTVRLIKSSTNYRGKNVSLNMLNKKLYNLYIKMVLINYVLGRHIVGKRRSCAQCRYQINSTNTVISFISLTILCYVK